MNQTIKKIFLVLVVMTAFIAFAYAATAPDKVTFPTKNGAVTFPHKAHGAMKDVTCKTCHHDMKGKVPDKKCGECHIDKEEGKRPTLKDAMHNKCKGCHTAQKKGPTKCNECHKKG